MLHVSDASLWFLALDNRLRDFARGLRGRTATKTRRAAPPAPPAPVGSCSSCQCPSPVAPSPIRGTGALEHSSLLQFCSSPQTRLEHLVHAMLIDWPMAGTTIMKNKEGDQEEECSPYSSITRIDELLAV
jgi:hypothetical protein